MLISWMLPWGILCVHLMGFTIDGIRWTYSISGPTEGYTAGDPQRRSAGRESLTDPVFERGTPAFKRPTLH